MSKMQKIKTPQPTKKNPLLIQQTQSPSLFDSIKHGFGLGIGSSIGHKAVDSLFNSKDENISKVNIEKECNLTIPEMYELYNKCLEEKKEDINCNKN